MSKTLLVYLHVFLIINVVALYLFFHKDEPNDKKFINLNSKISASPDLEYPFLARRVFVNNPKDIIINFSNLRNQLENLVESEKNNILVYFEYLPTGVSIGVNDNESFHLASLYKVPVVMAVYKEVENGKIDPNKEIILKKEDLDSNFGNLYKRGVGAKVTVHEAVDMALKESDNTAIKVLYKCIQKETLDGVVHSLDLPKSLEISFNPELSVKEYSSILKALYFSSVLSYSDSQHILEDLSESVFRDTLVSGVPESVKVSHKIGIFNPESTSNSNNDKIGYLYSDCGIFYLKNRDYLLCVAADDSEGDGKSDIVKVSKMVYEYVSHANSN